MPPHDALYDLPAPVELVLEDVERQRQVPDETSPMPSAALGEVSSPAKDTTTPTARRHCRISFSEAHNQVHEIDACYTQDEKEQLWYTNQEFYDMVIQAGYKMPPQATPSSSPPPVKPRRTRSAQQYIQSSSTSSSWFVKSLWIGTLVVGVLATTSALNGSSKREGR